MGQKGIISKQLQRKYDFQVKINHQGGWNFQKNKVPRDQESSEL